MWTVTLIGPAFLWGSFVILKHYFPLTRSSHGNSETPRKVYGTRNFYSSMGGNCQNYKIDFILHMKNFPVISLNKIENKIINNRNLWKQKPEAHTEDTDTVTKYGSLKLLEHTVQKWCSHRSWTGWTRPLHTQGTVWDEESTGHERWQQPL